MREILTIGTFDSPHIGHARLFQFCQTLGNTTVGINSDEFIEQYKGRAPLFSYDERARLIGGLGLKTVKNDSAGRELIDLVRPDILVIGSDWLRKDYLAQIDVTPDYLDENGISLVYTPYTPDISTTEIKRRVSESNRNSDNR